MSYADDYAYWNGCGPEDAAEEEIRICVRVVAETADGYFINRRPGRNGSTFLPFKCMSTRHENPGGDDILAVNTSWVFDHGYQDTAVGGDDGDDYLDDDGEDDFSVDPEIEAELQGRF